MICPAKISYETFASTSVRRMCVPNTVRLRSKLEDVEFIVVGDDVFVGAGGGAEEDRRGHGSSKVAHALQISQAAA